MSSSVRSGGKSLGGAINGEWGAALRVERGTSGEPCTLPLLLLRDRRDGRGRSKGALDGNVGVSSGSASGVSSSSEFSFGSAAV